MLIVGLEYKLGWEKNVLQNAGSKLIATISLIAGNTNWIKA
jgi:hypothetical protein